MQDAHRRASIGLSAARENDDSVFGGVTVVGARRECPTAEHGERLAAQRDKSKFR